MREDNGKIIHHSKLEVDALDSLDSTHTVMKSATFNKHTALGTVHGFIRKAIEAYYLHVEVNDPIIGKWDVRPFLRRKYKITIEEIHES